MAANPISTKTFKLNTGAELPAVGLGTWQGRQGTDDDAELEASIVHALRSGYRHIDTAQLYAVEDIVGRAIRASGVPREEITVVTKFWGHWHHDPAAALDISLKALGMDYVDVFLMHWPWATTPDPERRVLLKTQSPTFVETWEKMEALVGPKCRAIGVSNFTQTTLTELLQTAKIVPAINQVELHAFNPNLKLVPWCAAKGIHVTSWSTLGGGGNVGTELRSNDTVAAIAKAHGCSTGVVYLSWAVQRGISVVPKSGNPARIEENIRLVTLSDEEMEAINNLHKTVRRERLSDSSKSLQVEVDGKITLKGWSKTDFGWEDEQGNWLV